MPPASPVPCAGALSRAGPSHRRGPHARKEAPWPRADKAAAIAELSDKFRSSSAAVLTEYRGLTVKQITDLRNSLRGNATYAVVKNTLTELAAKDAGVTAFDGQLVGPTAIAFVDGDPVEAAKGLRDFAKANPLLVIKGGVLDGKALTRRRDHQARGPRVPRGSARQAGRRHERLAQPRRSTSSPHRCRRALALVDALRAKVEAQGPAQAAAPSEAAADETPADAPQARGRRATPRRRRRVATTRLSPTAQLTTTRHSGNRTGKDAIMAKLSTDELLDAFKEMTLIELSEFVKQFEDTFGVTAAAPVAVAAAGAAAAGGAAAAAEEQDEFDVVLEAAGDKKIQVIKEVRALTSLGLKEAKDLVDGAPKAVLEKVDKAAADKAKEQLEAAGATVTLK